MRPWYITAESLKASLDVKLTARNDAQVADAIEGASGDAEGLLGRVYYPRVATYAYPPPAGCVLYVDTQTDASLISVSSVTVAGSPLTGHVLAPVDGPPYDALEYDVPPARGLRGRPVSVAGLWGYDNVTTPGGTLAAAVVSTSATTVDVSDSSKVGVGSLLTVGTERMLVSARSMLDTGQTALASLAATPTAVTVSVADGSLFRAGEIVLIDAERLLIVDISGNDLTVKRNWDGTVLSEHDPGTPIYAPRRLTVERGVLGTTAATHLIAAAVSVQVYPGPLVTLVTALAQDTVLRAVSGQQHETASTGITPVLDRVIERAQAAIGRDSGFA